MVPFTSLERPEELEMKSKEQHDPGERAAPTPLVASFKATGKRLTERVFHGHVCD